MLYIARMSSFYAALPAVLVLAYYCQFFTQITYLEAALYTSACKIVTLAGVLTGNQSSWKRIIIENSLRNFAFSSEYGTHQIMQ